MNFQSSLFKRFISSSTTRAARNSPSKRAVKNLPQRTIQTPLVNSSSSSTFIKPHHPAATALLNEPTIIIERQIEMMNVFLGYEQANKYSILDVNGNKIGYMMERDFSIGKVIMRQVSKLHRPFTVDVFDSYGNIIFTIKRPFSWINSHIKAFLPTQTPSEQQYILHNTNTTDLQSTSFGSFNGRNIPVFQFLKESNDDGVMVGESIQNWHLWRRRYELFQREHKEDISFSQYGTIDAPFLSFDFPVLDSNGKFLAGVDRNWVGLGRELFTDTGVYVVRFDSQRSFEGIYPQEYISNRVLTYDQRAVLLANAVSIDFDYFSRHSRTGGGLLSFGSYDE